MTPSSITRTRTLGVQLIPGFELLDVFGPLEAFGYADAAFDVVLVAEEAGAVLLQ